MTYTSLSCRFLPPFNCKMGKRTAFLISILNCNTSSTSRKQDKQEDEPERRTSRSPDFTQTNRQTERGNSRKQEMAFPSHSLLSHYFSHVPCIPATFLRQQQPYLQVRCTLPPVLFITANDILFFFFFRSEYTALVFS